MYFTLIPKKVRKIKTKYRTINTKIPVPESIEILENLSKYEPVSMSGQPPIIWDHCDGVNVFDKYGNKWLDFSSGVLVANCGYNRKHLKDSIIREVEKGLLHTYCFPNEPRANLVKKLSEFAPDGLDKVFLLTTGSEATENSIKLMRNYGQKQGGVNKIGIISFDGAFHGRTLGAQMIGGSPSLKKWIVNLDKDMHQVPFPNCFRCPCNKDNYNNCEEDCFNLFVNILKEKLGGSKFKEKIAGVITETYQGGSAAFAQKEFIKRLKAWCEKNDILLTFDEVQAGFGRCGKKWGFEHYEVIPDIICCGKGISSSLPLSAVITRKEIIDLFGHAEMTSTHSGNPVCCAAALANLQLIEDENLIQNAAEVGEFLENELVEIRNLYKDVIGTVLGKGLVYGLHICKKDSKDPDNKTATKIVEKIIQKGIMLFAPVGPGLATIKINPPLIITKEAIMDGIEGIKEAIFEVV